MTLVDVAALALLLTCAALVGWAVLLCTGDAEELGRVIAGRRRR